MAGFIITAKYRQPFRIAHVGLAAGCIFDEVGVDDHDLNAGPFKMGMGALSS